MPFSFPQMPDRLTSTEQSILEYIAAHRDEFLCMTIGQLSDALGISEATVSRFARHVGCEDFRHLKRVILDQTVQRGPAQKLTHTLQTQEASPLASWLEQQRYNLQKTQELLDEEEFAQAVEAICRARRVFLYGKNASRAPAQLLEYRLRRIGVDVRQIPSAGTELLESLPAMGPEDLVVLFNFAKLSAEGRVLLDYQKKAGYQTLLFTSRAYHEMQDAQASIRLLVYRGEENAQHSMSAPVAVAEALTLAVSARMGSGAFQRLEEIRQLKDTYRHSL